MGKVIEPGHCVICGVIGRGKDNFICENCGNPDKITMLCRKCGEKSDLTGEDPERVGRVFGREFEIGDVIVLPSCSKCTDGNPEGTVLFYRSPSSLVVA